MVQLGGRGLEAEADASDLLAAQGAASWTFHLNRRKVSTRERLGASDLRFRQEPVRPSPPTVQMSPSAPPRLRSGTA